MKEPDKNETLFSLESTKGSGSFWTSANDPRYTFGFTGFKVWYPPEEPDEFEMFVREERKKAGIKDPEPERSSQVITKSQYAPGGQILYTKKLTVSKPSYYGIISTGSDSDSNE